MAEQLQTKTEAQVQALRGEIRRAGRAAAWMRLTAVLVLVFAFPKVLALYFRWRWDAMGLRWPWGCGTGFQEYLAQHFTAAELLVLEWGPPPVLWGIGALLGCGLATAYRGRLARRLRHRLDGLQPEQRAAVLTGWGPFPAGDTGELLEALRPRLTEVSPATSTLDHVKYNKNLPVPPDQPLEPGLTPPVQHATASEQD